MPSGHETDSAAILLWAGRDGEGFRGLLLRDTSIYSVLGVIDAEAVLPVPLALNFSIPKGNQE